MELEKQVGDKNCLIEYLKRNMLNNTYKKMTSHQWNRNNNQNKTFTEEELNNENEKFDKTHYREKKVIVIRDSMVSSIKKPGLSKSNKVLVKNFLDATSEKILGEMDKIIKEKPDFIILQELLI